MQRKASQLFAWIIVALSACLFSACAAATQYEKPIPSKSAVATRPAATAVHAPTSTPAATTTRTATPTLIPTPTPFAGLPPAGPHLILKNFDDASLLVFSVDGQQSIIHLPDGSKVNDIKKDVSPDGKWLAYYTGNFFDQPIDIHLNLLSLADGSTRKITDVLAKDFPVNMRPIAEEAFKKNLEPGLTVDDWFDIIQRDFPLAVMTANWSPDSQTLAFTAQIDGPSSDVYLYELKSATIRRLVDDLPNATQVGWSPDGKWVTFNNIIPGSIYTHFTLSFVPASSSLIHQPKNYQQNWHTGEGWLSPQLFLITGQGDGCCSHDIKVLNVETKQFTQIWPNIYNSYTYDPDQRQFMICGESNPRSADHEAITGLYLVQLNGSQRKIGDECIDDLTYIGWKGAEFAGIRDGEMVMVSTDGVVTKIADLDIIRGDYIGSFSRSPDGKWIAFWDTKKIEIFAQPGKLIQSIPLEGISSVKWAMDSQVQWIEGNERYLLSIPDSVLTSIPCTLDQCKGSLETSVWVP